MTERRMKIALDFDGVLHRYSKGWHDGSIYDPPVEGAVEAVRYLNEHFDLVVFTCRPDLTGVANWIATWCHIGVPVTGMKPIADLYIDDRGYRFDGDWTAAVVFAQKELLAA